MALYSGSLESKAYTHTAVSAHFEQDPECREFEAATWNASLSKHHSPRFPLRDTVFLRDFAQGIPPACGPTAGLDSTSTHDGMFPKRTEVAAF